MEVMPQHEARDQLGDVTLLRAGDTLLRVGTVQPMFLQPETTTHVAPAAPAPTASTIEVAQRTQAMATANAMQWHQGAEVRSHTPGLRALGPLAPRRKALPWMWRGLMRRCWSPAS